MLDAEPALQLANGIDTLIIDEGLHRVARRFKHPEENIRQAELRTRLQARLHLSQMAGIEEGDLIFELADIDDAAVFERHRRSQPVLRQAVIALELYRADPSLNQSNVQNTALQVLLRQIGQRRNDMPLAVEIIDELDEELQAGVIDLFVDEPAGNGLQFGIADEVGMVEDDLLQDEGSAAGRADELFRRGRPHDSRSCHTWQRLLLKRLLSLAALARNRSRIRRGNDLCKRPAYGGDQCNSRCGY